MNENKEKQEIRTPITVMMDMARNEIGNLVFSCMSKNNIPPGLMSYILKDILSDVMQVETEQLAEKYVALQASINQEVVDNGTHEPEWKVC